jgi:hypothetical protein
LARATDLMPSPSDRLEVRAWERGRDEVTDRKRVKAPLARQVGLADGAAGRPFHCGMSERHELAGTAGCPLTERQFFFLDCNDQVAL